MSEPAPEAISGDTIYVQFDHKQFSADQIARHELAHDDIREGRVSLDEVKERVIELCGDDAEKVGAVMQYYADAYEKAGIEMSAEEIFEEIVCDAAGDMNIFAPIESIGGEVGEFLRNLKQATEDTRRDDAETESADEDIPWKFSRNEKWTPHLKQSEWDLLNGVMDGTLAAEHFPIDEITNWFYKFQKGNAVFAIYSTDDDTVLYAVGSKYAKADAQIAKEIYEVMQNGTNRNAKGFNRNIMRLRVKWASDNANDVVPTRGGAAAQNDGLLPELAARKSPDGGRNNAKGAGDSGTNGDGGVKPKFSREQEVKKLDAEYLSAVGRGDIETAQRMVDEGARAVYNALADFLNKIKKTLGFDTSEYDAAKKIRRAHELLAKAIAARGDGEEKSLQFSVNDDNINNTENVSEDDFNGESGYFNPDSGAAGALQESKSLYDAHLDDGTGFSQSPALFERRTGGGDIRSDSVGSRSRFAQLSHSERNRVIEILSSVLKNRLNLRFEPYFGKYGFADYVVSLLNDNSELISDFETAFPGFTQAYEEVNKYLESSTTSIATPEGELTGDDAAYFDALKNRHREKAAEIIRRLAKGRGYTTEAWHSSRSNGIDIFRTYSEREFGTHFGTKDSAYEIADIRGIEDADLYHVFLKLGRTLELPDVFNNYYSLYNYIARLHGEDSGIYDRPNNRNVNTKEQFPKNDAYRAMEDMVLRVYNNSALQTHENMTRCSVLSQEYLKSLGYDSVAYRNDVEGKGSTSYIIFDQNRIKSADVITNDKDGNIIPPSKRFDAGKPEIDYSLPENQSGGMTDYMSKYLSAFGNLNAASFFRRAMEQLDTEYMSAVERGDMETAQRLVNEAAKAAGYVYRRNSRHQLDSTNNVPWTMFVEGDPEGLDNYGKYRYAATDNGAIDVTALHDVIQEMAIEYYGEMLDDRSIDPPDIVDSAGMFDDQDFVQYMWDNYFADIYYETGQSPSVRTQNGLVFLGAEQSTDRIKTLDPVTYDDEGKVIPLSERFNPEEKDIRWSLSENESGTSTDAQREYERRFGGLSGDELVDAIWEENHGGVIGTDGRSKARPYAERPILPLEGYYFGDERDDVKYDLPESGKEITEGSAQAALWDAMSHGDEGHDNLIPLGKMPQLIEQLSGVTGTLYIYRNHAYENMVTKEDAVLDGRYRNGTHYHGLGVDTLTGAILSLNDPTVAIADRMRSGNPAISMLLPEYGPNDLPIHAVVEFYANTYVNGNYEKRPHIAVTFYEQGQEDFGGYIGTDTLIENAKRDGKILAINEERSDPTVKAKLTRLGIISESDLKENIARFQKEVNDFKQKNKIDYSLPENQSGELTDAQKEYERRFGGLSGDELVDAIWEENHGGATGTDGRSKPRPYGERPILPLEGYYFGDERDDVKYDLAESGKITEGSAQAALWDAMSHGDEGHDNLIPLGKMPQLIEQLSGVTGTLYIYRNHAYENIVTEQESILNDRYEKDRDYHGLGVDTLTDAIMSLNNPTVAIADRMNNDGNPAISMLLPVYGPNNLPLHAVISFYAREPINGKLEKKPHIAVTFYEQEREDTDRHPGIDKTLEKALDNNKVLFVDKKRADETVTAKHLSLRSISESTLRQNIARFQREVNDFKKKNKIDYSLPESQSGGLTDAQREYERRFGGLSGDDLVDAIWEENHGGATGTDGRSKPRLITSFFQHQYSSFLPYDVSLARYDVLRFNAG